MEQNKTISIHQWHDYLGKNSKEYTYQKNLELTSLFIRVAQTKICRENPIAFLNIKSRQ